MARFGKPSVSQIIQKVVANDPATTELDFSGNSIYQMKSSEKTRELCDALVGSKHVTRVILQNCEIGDGEAALIGEMLAKNQSIEELILKENKPLKDVRARARTAHCHWHKRRATPRARARTCPPSPCSPRPERARDQEGAIAIAKGLAGNTTVMQIDLMGMPKLGMSERVLTAFIDMYASRSEATRSLVAADHSAITRRST